MWQHYSYVRRSTWRPLECFSVITEPFLGLIGRNHIFQRQQLACPIWPSIESSRGTVLPRLHVDKAQSKGDCYGSPLVRKKHSIMAMENITSLIIWPAPRAGKMNQILRCDWLPERARWSYLARSGLPASSGKKHFAESHIINPLLTKLVRSRWLDIGLVLFSRRVYGPRLRLDP